MPKAFWFLGIAVGLSLADPASAYWRDNAIDPPGFPWAACSAPYGCAGPLYTRRLVSPYTHRVVVRRRLVIRHHDHVMRRHTRRIAHRRSMHLHAHAAYAIRAGFQYIDDPQLAAALAWSDIVNAEATAP